MCSSQSPNKRDPTPWECKHWGSDAGLRPTVDCVGGGSYSLISIPTILSSSEKTSACPRSAVILIQIDKKSSRLVLAQAAHQIGAALLSAPAASADLRDSPRQLMAQLILFLWVQLSVLTQGASSRLPSAYCKPLCCPLPPPPSDSTPRHLICSAAQKNVVLSFTQKAFLHTSDFMQICLT